MKLEKKKCKKCRPGTIECKSEEKMQISEEQCMKVG